MPVYKKAPIEFTVNPYNQGVTGTKIRFSTMDKGTAKLDFQIFKDGETLPLSALKGKLTMVFINGSKRMKEVTILDKVEGKAEYILDDYEIKQFGTVKAVLVLFYSNGQTMSVHEFTFNIEQSLLDQDIVPLAEYYIDDFETLKYAIEKMSSEAKQTLEELRAKFEDLEKIETKEGAQAKVDEHAKNTKLHVTEAKQKSWDAKETPEGAQSKADAAVQKSKDFVSGFQKMKITTDTGMPLLSIKDTSISILDSVINNGLGQGTFYAIAGSKDLPNHRSFRGFFHITDAANGKGTFGWVYATDYINNIYTNYLNNNIWSGWARLSNHNLLSETGQSQLLPNGTDILTLPSGYYYAVGTNVVNMPSKTDSSWFNIYVVDNSNNRKTFHIIRSGDNLHWWGTVHTDGSFKGWERMLSEKDLTSSWNQVTFVTGTTKHFASNPLKFSIRQNALHLRGSFEGIPANDTVIARFTQKPSGTTVFGGTTVGSYGTARLTLGVDGALKFDGLNANDNSKVTRIEINEEIPLW
ncbi:BppU family phage baseplate upper protein [Bacillus pumilus]|uniref:BppU family phage baseplate upper protein n=2 Tax=Bacillati TaxID=1783272 RepID=UPI002ABE11D4|nr:BppU family phage baseplate upper protein [Bacillus pumilus]